MAVPTLPIKVKTKVSWAGEEEGDLGFIEGEVIEVTSVVDESWYCGRLRRNGAEGIFPKEYVLVMEERNCGGSVPNSPANSKPSTPVKEVGYDQRDPRAKSGKNAPPLKYSDRNLGSKRTSQLYDRSFMANGNNDWDNTIGYDSSFDRSSGHPSVTPTQSPYRARAHRNSASTFPTKHFSPGLAKEELDRQKEKEIEKFKALQQQQQYQIKKIQKLQEESYRNSIAFAPQNHKSPNSKSNKVQNGGKNGTGSPYYDHIDGEPPMTNSTLALYNNSRIHYGHQTPQKQNLKLFNNHTVESFVPEVSPKSIKSPVYPSQGYDQAKTPTKSPNYGTQTYERSPTREQNKKYWNGGQFYSPKHNYDGRLDHDNNAAYNNSVDSSYVSEGVLSSRRNYQSKDDLSKKLTRIVSTEQEDDFGDDDSDNSSSSSPPPPPPPKRFTQSFNFEHFDSREAIQMEPAALNKKEYVQKTPYNADDFMVPSDDQRDQLTEEEYLRLSQKATEELKNSTKSLQSDVLNLSELSATSAGSFIRHKHENSLRQQQTFGMSTLSIGDDLSASTGSQSRSDIDSQQLMNSIFQDKKSRHPNIFKKLLQKKKETDKLNLIEQKLQQDQEVDWTTLKMDLNRMNSLTSQDKQKRTKRVVREDPSVIIKPLDYISEINTNEYSSDVDTGDEESLELPKVAARKVETFMAAYDFESDINEMIHDISIKFASCRVSQIRCVLLHLCKIKIIEEEGRILQIKPKLHEVLYKGEASIYQLNYLFKKILDALRIPSEIVLGFWKKPNEFYHKEKYSLNHCWLSILVENRFVLLDIFSFKNGSIFNIKDDPHGFNNFYFLSEPLKLVSTHIPSIIDLQHVVPPVDQCVAFYLPRTYSGFYKSRLKFRNFNNALTNLADLEVFEFELEIPIDVELFTLIKTAKVTTNELSLAQVYWNGNKRIAKIKALLPENVSVGVLQVYAGEKGLQKYFDNVHELAIVVSLSHEGTYRPCKFVSRFPTVQSQNNDLYIKQPQTNKIIVKNSYNFEILQFPSSGINNISCLANEGFKMVIESPSGKYFKLQKSDPSQPYGVYECNVKCQETGVYRGLVIGDSGNSWYVFAQWDCVQGSVVN